MIACCEGKNMLDKLEDLRTLIKGTQLPGTNRNPETLSNKKKPIHTNIKDLHKSKLEQNEENIAFPKPELANDIVISTTTTEQPKYETDNEKQEKGTWDEEEDDNGQHDELWMKFKKQWEDISTFYASEQLTKKDKLLFISTFKRAQTISSMMWPLAFIGTVIGAMIFLCVMCCCVKRAIFCCGRQFCDFSKNSAMNYNEAKSMELRTIVRPMKKLTDNDARRIAYYVRSKANHPDSTSQANQGPLSTTQTQARAIVHAEQIERPTTTVHQEHTYSNVGLQHAPSTSTIAESIYSQAK